MFTRNPSRWRSPVIKEKEAAAFKENCVRLGYDTSKILPHDSYLINLGAPDSEKLRMSREAFMDELQRCVSSDSRCLIFIRDRTCEKAARKTACVLSPSRSTLLLKT